MQVARGMGVEAKSVGAMLQSEAFRLRAQRMNPLDFAVKFAEGKAEKPIANQPIKVSDAVCEGPEWAQAVD